MKSILVLVMALFSLSTWAQFDVSHISKEFRNLGRTQAVTVEGVDYDFGYITEFGIAFYQTPYDQIQMSVNVPYKKSVYVVNIVIEDNLITFEVPNGTTAGKFDATKTPVKVTHNHNTPAGLSLFDSTTPTGAATKVIVELKKPLFSAQSITEIITKTGSLEFNACDGCEHGDQMMVDGINVVDLEFGTYYTSDCGGTVHRLLGQLLVYDPNNETDEDSGLAVPFTFKGNINMDSGDLIEDLDSMWIADSKVGQLFIGNSTNIPMFRFLDSMVYKVAQKLNVEAHTIWEDVMNEGNFTSYQNNILTFTYKNVVVKTNLLTAQTVE